MPKDGKNKQGLKEINGASTGSATLKKPVDFKIEGIEPFCQNPVSDQNCLAGNDQDTEQ